MFEYANLLLEVKDIIERKTIYIPINTEIEDKNLIEIAKIYGIKDGFAEIVYNDNYKKRVFGGQIHISEFEYEVIDKHKVWQIVLYELIRLISLYKTMKIKDKKLASAYEMKVYRADNALYNIFDIRTYNSICERLTKDISSEDIYRLIDSLEIKKGRKVK